MKSIEITDENPVGAKVRVRRDCRCPADLRGLVGIVLASYGQPGYAAFDVLLENGASELFWQYELIAMEEEVVPGSLAG